MNTQIAMVRRTIEAQVDTKRDRGPRRILLAAVEADLRRHSKVRICPNRTTSRRVAPDNANLIRLLRLELIEQLLRLLLGRKSSTHFEGGVATGAGRIPTSLNRIGGEAGESGGTEGEALDGSGDATGWVSRNLVSFAPLRTFRRLGPIAVGPGEVKWHVEWRYS